MWTTWMKWGDLETVPPLRKTSNRHTYRLSCERGIRTVCKLSENRAVVKKYLLLICLVFCFLNFRFIHFNNNNKMSCTFPPRSTMIDARMLWLFIALNPHHKRETLRSMLSSELVSPLYSEFEEYDEVWSFFRLQRLTFWLLWSSSE